MSRTLGPAQQLELDTIEQLEIILAERQSLDSRFLKLGLALFLADGRAKSDNIRTASAWLRYVAARNLLVIDGKRFSLDSSLGEIASALKDAK